MTKKLLTMRVEPEDLAKIDARAKRLGITRTALILTLAEDDPKLSKSMASGGQIRDGETIVRPATAAITGRAVKAQPDEFGSPAVDLSKIDIADGPIKPAYGSRLKQPRKGK